MNIIKVAPRSRMLIVKILVAQLVKKSVPLVEVDGSLLRSGKLATENI
jgi:hypothetical protein